MVAARREREIEDRIDDALDRAPEYGLELGLLAAVLWTALVLGNPETYANSAFAHCLGEALSPGGWFTLGVTLALTGGLAMGIDIARPRRWAFVVRAGAGLAELCLFIWVGTLALCGRSTTASLAFGFVWLAAAGTLLHLISLCASRARDEAAAAPVDDPLLPEEPEDDGG